MPAALITGCSSGFGEAIAVAFAREGYRVVATMRNPDGAPASLKALAAEHPEDFVLAPLDVTDPASRQAAIDLTLDRFGGLDLLINNAGISARGSFEDTQEELFRKIFETNLFGPLELARLALPVMRARGGGRIINVTSVAAVLKTPLIGAYCASKQAMDTMTIALDAETRSFGVRAICLMPGPFKTSLPQKSLDREASPPYAKIAAHFNTTFDGMEAKAPDDFSPVVQAALAAAGDADPQPRYLAGTEVVPVLPPIMEAIAPLSRIGLILTGQMAPPAAH